MKTLSKYIILSACTALSFTYGFSQDKVELDFNLQVDQVIENQVKNYSELSIIFKDDLQDTLKMQFLASKSKELNYLDGESFALCNLGVYFRDIARYNTAIAHHQNAYNIALSANNIELQVINLNMLGVVSRRLDNNQKAIEYHQEALKTAENQEEITESLNKSIAVSYNSIGNIYLALNEPDNAIKNFNKSLAIEKALDNKLGLAMNYHNFGYALEAKKNIESALEYYLKSLEINKAINDFKGQMICNNSIAQVYLWQKRPEEAVELLIDNLNLAIRAGDPYYIASTYIGLGWAQYDLNKFDEGERNILKALEIAEDKNYPSFIATANSHLSEIYRRKGDYKRAFERYIIADEIYDNIRSNQNYRYVELLNTQYESEKNKKELIQLAKENDLKDQKIKEDKRNLLVIILGIVIMAGVLLIYSRQRRLKNEKKIITLEQDMLRSQMNPHFIFNSLNSIKLYIINNEKENAVYYLNKFSKLIRKILLASKEKEISLAEELETMDLYINIENIRFSNEINYLKNISSDVDLDAIKVPSLILQPFLENALWHGLSSKKSDKRIKVDVTKENENLILISITDNGIGRKEAERIKKNKSLKRKSLGLAITNERLSNFYKEYNREYSVNIIDLYDENEKASGTRVLIKIPIEKAIKLKTA